MMTATSKTAKTRQKTRRAASAAAAQPIEPNKQSKLDLMLAHLTRPGGASLAELVAATGWQPHSVRGALAGALKKKGHAITAEKIDGERRYRIGEPK
jgi:hypothetical protein